MPDDPAFPDHLAINAWTGDGPAEGPAAAKAVGWGLRRTAVPRRALAAEVVDDRDWAHAEVGWGLVLPEADSRWTAAERAVAADAPDAVQALRAFRRNAPVFRYADDLGTEHLRRYFPDGRSAKIVVNGAKPGVGPDQLPKYLLIVGSPAAVPWRLQYVLSTAPRYVGRLDLEADGLANYVRAVETDWADGGAHLARPCVWTADHGPDDITHLMRQVIAEPVYQKLKGDADVREAVLLAGAEATAAALADALKAQRPGLVVTTSHGLTGPLDDAAAMAAGLGLLVATDGGAVRPGALLGNWVPGGAVWYAHACCGAGSDARTSYDGLFAPGSKLDQTLRAVAALGSLTAPLPRALLGAPSPLRAFIGHVEPTFNWTLRAPENKQVLTDSVRRALYGQLYQPRPATVGMAFEACYAAAAGLLANWNQTLDQLEDAGSEAALTRAKAAALRLRLAGLDRQGMVILGDPAVCPPSVQAPGG